MRPTQSRVKELFTYDENAGTLIRRITVSNNAKAGSVAGWVNGEGYVCVRVDRINHKVHHIVWLYVNGHWPKGVIDHINQNKQDNRIANLRDTTIQVNNINKGSRKDSKTGVVGVTWRERDKLFYAACKRDGKQNYLGSFKTLEDAAKAVEKFRSEYEIGRTM